MYKVRDLLQTEQFKELRLCSGEKGLDREIKGTRIIEETDMENYLIGGEILVTSLIVYSKCSEEEFKRHLEALRAKNIAGFVIKIRDITQKRKLTILETFCQKYDIALISMPEDMHFWKIVRYIIDKVNDREMARLKYFKITHDNFSTLMINRREKGATPKDVIWFLGLMVENPVSVYHENFNCYISTQEESDKLVISEDIKPYHPAIRTKFKYKCQPSSKGMQYVVQVNIINETIFYVAITESNRKLLELDYMAIENGIIAFQSSFMRELAKDEVSKRYQKDLIHNLMNGVLSYDEAVEVADYLGLESNGQYRIVAVHTIKHQNDGKYTKEQIKQVEWVEMKLRMYLPEETIYRNVDQIIMIMKAGSDQEDEEKIEEIQRKLQNDIVSQKKEIDLQIGIGTIVEGYHGLKKSYEQAKKALACVEVVRWYHKGQENDASVVCYSKLGFFKLFLEAENFHSLLRYVPETLKRLKEYEDIHESGLLLTLARYVGNNMNKKQTAEDLNLQYRSLSYRIEKIKKIAGIDFDNGLEMLAIRNGLLIYQLNNELK